MSGHGSTKEQNISFFLIPDVTAIRHITALILLLVNPNSVCVCVLLQPLAKSSVSHTHTAAPDVYRVLSVS